MHLISDLSLNYLEYLPPIKQKVRLAVFLHGRGANEENLFHLAPQLGDRFIILSVRAPLVAGRKAFYWFHTQYPPGAPPEHSQEEANVARELLLSFIAGAQKKYGVSAKDTYLFGFSQGAILSLSVLLSTPECIGGIAALSGRILPEYLPCQANAESLKDFPVLVSHGTQDDVLSIKYGRSAQFVLSQLPVDLRYSEYPMGHSITDMNFSEVQEWFATRD